MSPVDTATAKTDIRPTRAGIAAMLLAATFSILAFAPPRDRAKPVHGIACSVLSEDDVSAAIGTPMQLMPTTGSICRYVSTANGPSRAVIVVARSGRPRTYAFHVVPQSANDTTATSDESRLTHMLQRELAQMR